MSELNRKYEKIGQWSHEDVERAICDDDAEALILVAIGVSMHGEDWRYAQDLCVRLSSHPHFNVRGNAVLGFGHVARVHRQLDRTLVQPIIQAALRDENDYIRGQAVCAMDDTTFFLKWHYDETDVA